MAAGSGYAPSAWRRDASGGLKRAKKETKSPSATKNSCCFSALFAEPSYHQGVVPSSVFSAQGRTGRAVPDVSANGDPNAGYLVGQTQTFPDGTVKYSEYRLGGTSLSSPIMAGIMALADQASGSPH